MFIVILTLEVGGAPLHGSHIKVNILIISGIF